MNNKVTLKIGYDTNDNISVVHADKLTLKGAKIDNTWVVRGVETRVNQKNPNFSAR